jgi:hypothetical protein
LNRRRALTRIRVWAQLILVAAVVVGAAGCRTLQYREIQHDFGQAVRADNAGSESPFTDWYQIVLDELTPKYIERLDARLRPNAWMLRAVAAWRTGRFDVAEQSATAGLRERTLLSGSRDDVILRMIRPLVIDSELRERFADQGGRTATNSYASFQADFETALTLMDEAREAMRESTPNGVRYYWNYQQWRILQNWAFVISRIEDSQLTFKQQVYRNAAFVLGQDLEAALSEAREAIPVTNPLRQLIDAREQGR